MQKIALNYQALGTLIKQQQAVC